MALKNKKIIVTGGPTREWLDPVRYISNASSGKMGIALADASFRRAKETIFIHGPVDRGLIADKPYKLISVETTEGLLSAVLSSLGPDSVLIMAAAPADYKPLEKSAVKIKKTDGNLVIRLTENPDILKTVAIAKENNSSLSDLFIAGFAAETDNTEHNALKKLRAKNLDMICLNDVTREGAGFSSDSNIITIFFRDRSKVELPIMSKADASEQILNCIEKELQSRG
ncbi:MAG: hypothetical protein JW864_05125 [Spirochaetes bacterium]|nr:hypothetical protein [Spirochaetota bacterium]